MGNYQSAPLCRMGFNSNKPNMMGHYSGVGAHKTLKYIYGDLSALSNINPI